MGVDKDVIGDSVLRIGETDAIFTYCMCFDSERGAAEKLGATKARCEEKKKYEEQMLEVDFQPIVFESFIIKHSASN